MKPWCFPNLGGVRIAPGFDIGQGYLAGPSMVGGRSQSTAKWHVHWYVYPLLYWMEILTDFVCFEQASFDIAYMTEVDPLWQDDSLAALINPEAIIFANPLAKAACAGDCRSEEHTSELQSLMRISYAVFCLKKKNKIK